jgi:hypothetical protein
MPPDLIRGWEPVRRRKCDHSRTTRASSVSNGTEFALARGCARISLSKESALARPTRCSLRRGPLVGSEPSGDFARKRFRAKPRDLPTAFPDDFPGLGDLIALRRPGGIRTRYQYERLIDELARIDASAPRAIDVVWLAHSLLLGAGGSVVIQPLAPEKSFPGQLASPGTGFATKARGLFADANTSLALHPSLRS